MDKKILLIIIAVIAVVAIGVGAISLAIFGQTTEVDTKFLSGTIKGGAVENNTNITLPGWEVNYDDTMNGIRYEFLMTSTLNFTKDMFINALGAKKIATEEYNGVKWEIYYLDSDAYKKLFNNRTMNQSGYICFASGKNGDYGVSIGSENVNSDNSLNSDLFKNYVEPLLKSITLKDPDNAPKEHQFMNMTNEEFNYFKNYVKSNGWDGLI